MYKSLLTTAWVILVGSISSQATTVSITMNRETTTMTLIEKGTDKNIEVGEASASFQYTLDLAPGTYVLTGINKDGKTVQGTMELNISDETDQTYIIWTVTSIKVTNKNSDNVVWSYGTDYTIEELSCRTREGKVIPITLGESTTAGAKACLITNGGSFNCTFRPSKPRQNEGYMDTYGSATLTGNTACNVAVPMGGDFTLEFPTNARCMVFRKLGGTNGSGSIHYVPFVKIEPKDSTAGKMIYRLAEGNTYNYRLWQEGKMTKAGIFNFYNGSAYDGKVWDENCDGFNHIVLTAEDLKESNHYFNHNASDNTKANVANILLNINEKGYLQMKTGDVKDLLAQRDWQLTNSQTANYFVEPSYHYAVYDMNGNPGSDVISIENADTEINPWATLKALKKGSAIVLVKYDAICVTQIARTGSGNEKKPYTMNETDFLYGADWSACWGENTGVFVVSVDEPSTALETCMFLNEDYNAETMKNSGKYVDAEHDCFYYLKGEEGYSYTFFPIDVAKVEVAYPQLTDLTASYNGFTPVIANEDGSYTVLLKHGRQIVCLTGTDGGKTYQVLTAKECTQTITNVTHDDGKYYPGDDIEIQFDGLFHPANKMSGIYNMSAYITYNGVPTGTALILGKNQYQFGGTSAAQLVKITIPTDWDTSLPFVLNEGVIQVNGFGDPIGNHRLIDKVAGRSPNFTAISHKTYFGSIPDISLEISTPTAVKDVLHMPETDNNQLYDLSGQKIDDKNGYRIFIKNGRKYLNKSK